MASSAQVKLLQNFQEYLSVEKGLSDNSIFSYGYDLNKFKSYLDKQQIDLLNVQSKDIMKFLVEEKSRKISSKTLAREVVAIRQFYKYLRDEKQLDFNPTDKIETPEVMRAIPDHLTLDEINELFDKIKEDNIYELRDKCIFELLYSSGLRISEACNLKIEDIDLENMSLAIEGKGGKRDLFRSGKKH